ncbi:MAG: hypothetical protein ACTSRS_04810 [Candidatus Helarchaeota archaeon]
MEKQYNYDRFFLGIFTNRRIPFNLWIGIYFLVTFFIPEILFHELLIGVSWTNIFFMSNELLSKFPAWFATPFEHVDWLNVSYLIGGAIALLLSKGLYERACDLREEIFEQYQGHPEEERESVEAEINNSLKLCFKTIPKILTLIVVIFLPVIYYYTLIQPFLLIDPQKTLIFSIEAVFKMEFIIFVLGYIFSITLSFGFYLRKLSNKVLRINVFHPDRVGGLRQFGTATIYNLIIWSTISSLGVIITGLNIATASLTNYYIFNAVFFGALLIGSLLIFILPIHHIHHLMAEKKKEMLQKLATLFEQNFRRFKPKKEYEEKDEDYEQLLLRLNAISWQTYYNDLKVIHEWPWDTSILARFYFALLIPIVAALLNSLVMMPF